MFECGKTVIFNTIVVRELAERLKKINKIAEKYLKAGHEEKTNTSNEVTLLGQ